MRFQVKAGFMLVALLAACGGSNPTRWLLEDPAAVTRKVPLRAASIEVRDVVLPSYGQDAPILLQDAGGGLTALRGAEWADNSAEAMTAELARRLDLGSTASVAAEPWPLNQPADLRLDVRYGNLVAGQTGFRLEGQFAVSSPDGRSREFLQRFDIRQPLADQSPAAIAAAYSRALDELSARILKSLAR